MTALFLLYLQIKSSYMKKLFFTLLIILSFCNLGFSQNTIDSRLQEILNQRSDEMIPVNIIFKSQIDIAKLKTRADATLDKKVRRNILVDEFKSFSEEKQQEVLSILQAETRSSKVTKIKKHWLTNAISCTVSRDVIYLLAEHPDIAIIGYDEMVKMVFDEEQQQTTQMQQTRNDDDLYLTDNILMVNADKVWKMGYTGKGVIVAVIDSGVNYMHTDLADHLWDGGEQYPNHGYNTIEDNFDTMDRYSHGTHCAGTVCGDGTSGIYTGIAPDATLMCVKALDDKGYGSANSIVAAMEFAIENHADILNMSLGIVGPSEANKTMLRQTCVNALEHGVIASVAAGNYGNNTTPQIQVPNNILAPADCPPPWLHPDQQANPGTLSCVVSVGATDYFENIYEGSSRGPVTWTDTEYNDYPYGGSNIGLIRPDVCAPGVGIKSLDYAENNGYYLKTGTSMAAPCVAGVMALMLEQKPDLTPAEICEILETTAKKLSETKSNMFGSGLIDAAKAMGISSDEDDNDNPEQPGDNPEQPGDNPENPGDEPEQPGDTITFVITAVANPEEAGIIIGAGTFKENDTVTLTATANEGYKFVNWTENNMNVSTDEEYSFVATSDRDLVAKFEKLEEPDEPENPEQPGDNPEQPEQPEQPGDTITFVITAVANPEEAGIIIGAGSYNENDTVTLTATANEGYKFVRWTENNMGVSTDTEYSFVATSNRDLVAKFEKLEEPDEPGDEPENPEQPEEPGEGIEEFASSFNIYPNPVSDRLYIETLTQTQTLTVEIYDVYGRRQSMVNGQQSTVIDVSDLNSGVYFVKVVTSEGETMKRFIKD